MSRNVPQRRWYCSRLSKLRGSRGHPACGHPSLCIIAEPRKSRRSTRTADKRRQSPLQSERSVPCRRATTTRTSTLAARSAVAAVAHDAVLELDAANSLATSLSHHCGCQRPRSVNGAAAGGPSRPTVTSVEVVMSRLSRSRLSRCLFIY